MAVGIRNNGKLDFNVVFAMSNDVAEPIVVRLDGIDREGSDQTVHAMELVPLHGQATNLQTRVKSAGGKQDGPFSSMNESHLPSVVSHAKGDNVSAERLSFSVGNK
jgi:hypothetical protein